jgi:hypothetical protein
MESGPISTVLELGEGIERSGSIGAHSADKRG